MDSQQAIARNIVSWEQRTPVHLSSAIYQADLQLLREGGLTLLPPTDSEIGEVSSKRVLHLQCHLGHDTLSLARLGADVTGLDFSPASIAAAMNLASELGISARFVVADAQHADKALPGEQFDLVFASFGVFSWIPDIQLWMRSAANMLKPGGCLYVADGHPFMDMVDDDHEKPYGIDLRYSYFDEQPQIIEAGPSYTGGTCVAGTIQYIHSLGKLVTALVQAGMALEYLHEFPGAFYQRHQAMAETGHGTWDFPPPLRGKLPMIFSMRAVKR